MHGRDAEQGAEVRAVALAGLALLLVGCPGSQIGCVEVLDTSASHLTFTTARGRSGCARNPAVRDIRVYDLGGRPGYWHAYSEKPHTLPPKVVYGIAPPGFTNDFPTGQTAATPPPPLQAGTTVRIWISGYHMVGGADVTLTE
jgi:hypothetical protein